MNKFTKGLYYSMQVLTRFQTAKMEIIVILDYLPEMQKKIVGAKNIWAQKKNLYLLVKLTYQILDSYHAQKCSKNCTVEKLEIGW